MNADELRLDPAMTQVIPVINEVFGQFAPPGFVIEFTAGKEWFQHSVFSLHHSGSALDIRTRTLPDHGVGAISSHIAKVLQHTLDKRLGHRKYTVLWNDAGPKRPHIHVQYNKGGRWSEPGDFGTGSTRYA